MEKEQISKLLYSLSYDKIFDLSKDSFNSDKGCC